MIPELTHDFYYLGAPARRHSTSFDPVEMFPETSPQRPFSLSPPPRRRAFRCNVRPAPATAIIGLPLLRGSGGIPKPENRRPFSLQSLAHARPTLSPFRGEAPVPLVRNISLAANPSPEPAMPFVRPMFEIVPHHGIAPEGAIKPPATPRILPSFDP